MSDKFPPSVTAFRVYERTSAKGKSYFSGTWGGVRVAILKTAETDRDGNPIWEVRLSQAPPRPSATTSDSEPSAKPSDARRDWQEPPKQTAQRDASGEIPF